MSLKQTVANLLVFVNAHLAINHANEVAIIASHVDRAHFLYPKTTKKEKYKAHVTNGDGKTDTETSDITTKHTKPIGRANKYRPFAVVEQGLLSSLTELLTNTSIEALASDGRNTMIAGALTMALAYISKTGQAYWPNGEAGNDNNIGGGNSISRNGSSRITSVTDTGMAPSLAAGNANDGASSGANSSLTSRILVVSISGDLAGQYIPVMNAVFAAQRLHIPIDVLKLAGDTAFLQQASDATGGIYLAPRAPKALLQYLMMVFLPDQTARQWLVPAIEGAVDFRAACFCHRDIITIGYVCSICLSSKSFQLFSTLLRLYHMNLLLCKHSNFGNPSFLCPSQRFNLPHLWIAFGGIFSSVSHAGSGTSQEEKEEEREFASGDQVLTANLQLMIHTCR